MPYFHGKAATKYPCVKCDEVIPTWDGIFCDTCANWYHFKCDQLEIQHQEAFRALPETPYICKSCRCDEKGAFSFSESLERLHKGAKQGMEKLYMYAERERQFMREEFSFSGSRSSKVSTEQQVDALVREFCPSQTKKAAKVTKDGSSLFSAVSVALVGSERLAVELRVRCCIEMVVYDSFYRWQENFTDLQRCAPEYQESCVNCATPGEDSSVWTLSALATVVRRNIESVYPSVNGKIDPAISILNTVFPPRGKVDDGENLKIFWGGPKKGDLPPGSWVPEVFVPLVDLPSVPNSPAAVSPFLTPSRVSGRVRKPTPKVLAITNKKIKTEMKVVVEDSVDDAGDADFKMPSDFTLEPTNEDVLEQKYQLDKIDMNWMDKYSHVAERSKPLKGTAFLPAQEVFNELISSKDVCPSIPSGRKEDVYFLVDNSRNLKYKHRRNYFQDDCGRYDQRSGTTCKSYYILLTSNMLQQLMKDKGLYCKESRRVAATENSSPQGGRGRPRSLSRGRSAGGAEQKVTKWIPMEPQPQDKDVMVLHRYYSSLDCDPTYKRRISWFSNLPERFENGRASFLVEYITKPIAGLVLPRSRKGGLCSLTHPASDDERNGDGTVASQMSDADTNSQSEDVDMIDQTDASTIDPVTGEISKTDKKGGESEKAAEELDSQNTPSESNSAQGESQITQTESQNTEAESQSTEAESQSMEVDSQPSEVEGGQMPVGTEGSMVIETSDVEGTELALVEAAGQSRTHMQIVFVQDSGSQTLTEQ
ncbi:hypothetical protein ACOMHN_055410 [Nucella lapillus]